MRYAHSNRDRILEEIAEERSSAVKVTKVNVDENSDLANRYEIRSIPTLMVFDAGELKDQVVGLVQEQALLDKLDNVINRNHAEIIA